MALVRSRLLENPAVGFLLEMVPLGDIAIGMCRSFQILIAELSCAVRCGRRRRTHENNNSSFSSVLMTIR
jgi:hypothetical protein